MRGLLKPQASMGLQPHRRRHHSYNASSASAPATTSGNSNSRMSMLDPALRRNPAHKTEPFTNMRMFLDSANIPQWELWTSTGLFYGITTNPVILERDNQKCTIKNLTNLCRMAGELGVSELQLQAWGESTPKMVSVALDLFGMNPDLVVVKLPCTLEGLQAAALLRESSVRVTITGIYSPQQVVLAQLLGADYAAPYLGRMNDAYGNNQGFGQVAEMQQILDAQDARTRLLVASVRDTSEISSLAAKGCDTFTISPAIAGKLFNVQYTLDAAADFEQAARRMGAYDELREKAEKSALLAEQSDSNWGHSQDEAEPETGTEQEGGPGPQQMAPWTASPHNDHYQNSR